MYIIAVDAFEKSSAFELITSVQHNGTFTNACFMVEISENIQHFKKCYKVNIQEIFHLPSQQKVHAL